MINNFHEVNKVLTRFIPNSVGNKRYTLDRMYRLMNYLGDPQNKLNIIHVAGTSGKTSTCYYIASLLRGSGKKVGLTVSPHIDQINERVQINLIPLPEKEFCTLLDEFLKLIEQSAIKPTYFEVLIAFAFWVFEKMQVDYAVIEVGLGGLLDGTNVINRADKVCVITDIGLDHTSILGDTIEEIAFQKAGIIHNQNPVIFNKQPKNVMEVFTKTAHQHLSNIIINDDSNINSTNDEQIPAFQLRNFSLALATYNYIKKRDNLPTLSQAHIRTALQVTIPARMEIMHYKNRTVIIDGSHNKQKLAALVPAVKATFSNKKVDLLVSFGSNKEPLIKESLQELNKISDTITLTSFNLGKNQPRKPINPKDLSELAKKCGLKNVSVIQDPEKAFLYALDKSQDILLVTGSFYLLNHIRPLLKAHLS